MLFVSLLIFGSGSSCFVSLAIVEYNFCGLVGLGCVGGMIINNNRLCSSVGDNGRFGMNMNIWSELWYELQRISELGLDCDSLGRTRIAQL